VLCGGAKARRAAGCDGGVDRCTVVTGAGRCPVVSASALPLTLLDAVSFALPPPFPFVPVFRIFGFTTGVCGNFTAFGA